MMLRKSTANGLDRHPASFVRVVRRHIDLYVNDYTLALDEAAVLSLLAFAGEAPAGPPVFAC